MGWRTGQKSLLLPVAGEFFLLTLPFIERANRTSEVLLYISGNATNQAVSLAETRNGLPASYWPYCSQGARAL